MEVEYHAPGRQRIAVVWVDDWPGEVLGAVEPFVERIVRLLPRWIHKLDLHWDAADGNSVAYTRVQARNRWASIHICPQFLDESKEQRWNTLVHEVSHIYFDRMGDAFRHVVKQLGDDAAQQIANQWFYDAEEEAVTDLAELLCHPPAA